MIKHYDELTSRMMSELKSISESMKHQGEKGRNNEAILRKFLCDHLPSRFTVSTGFVVSADGAQSGQVDLIIHDRLETPGLVLAHEWKLVPIESVYAVISVKTTLDKGQLREAMKSIESVRKLPRKAAFIKSSGRFTEVPEERVLRPRALVFSLESNWKSYDSFNMAFTDLLKEFKDDDRPNGVCILDSGFLIRRAYTEETIPFQEHALLHFFIFLVRTISNRPRYNVDLAKYFIEDYGLQ